MCCPSRGQVFIIGAIRALQMLVPAGLLSYAAVLSSKGNVDAKAGDRFWDIEFSRGGAA